MSLPVSVGFSSGNNHKYLRYISEDKQNQLHGFLQFSGDELVTPYSKFNVEVAKTGEGSFVHIRSTYNNKYLVFSSTNHGWIHAGADESNEDQSSSSCTMFEPVVVDNDPNMIRLRHVQLGNYLSLGTGSEPFTCCLFAGSTNNNHDNSDVFVITNLETLFVLPKYITFMGDNGSYLSGRRINNLPYVQFLSDNNKDATVWYENLMNNDGSVCVKSDYFGKFLRRGTNDWIFADSDDTTKSNPNSVFLPIEIENNVVAFRNFGNNSYCKRFTTPLITSGLSANIETIDTHAKLYVEETVSSRFINNVEYHLKDTRIYDKSQVILPSLSAQNNRDNPLEVTFKITYSESVVATWSSSISRKIFNKVNLDAKLPPMENENIDRFSGEYNWGEAITITTKIDNSYTTTVPANTKVTVTVIATKASFDIPFKYTQKDTLFNGKQIISNFNDGLFTGLNLFDFKYDFKQEPIAK